MRESQRLAYLDAIGVTGWVPRMPLDYAPARLPAEFEAQTGEEAPEPLHPSAGRAGEPKSVEPLLSTDPVDTLAVSPSARLVAQRRAQVAAQSSRTAQGPAPVIPAQQHVPEPPPTHEHQVQSVAPFYLQLWMAGPCALLIEISDPGLEKGTSEHNLLCDILRAAGLPPTPRLQADFRWPLSRNPQVARSAEAASEALQAFMQARLELQPVDSIGCFGVMAGLLATSDPDSAAALKGREQALEELGVGWFAPGLEKILKEPGEKAGLWQLLKRVKPRWTDAQ